LEATLTSNLLQIERAVQMIVKTGKRKIGVLGFAFKAGTDDLRESPVVSVIERLIGKGYDIKLYDKKFPSQNWSAQQRIHRAGNSAYFQFDGGRY
jgi:UDP-glucose 6-dehydrogenase